MLSVELVEGRKLIVLWAPGGQNRPYKAPVSVTAKQKSWRYYIRRYSSTVEAKDETEQELLSLPAIATGCLEMTLPEQPNSRLQRYRLTATGQHWLQANSQRSTR